MSTGHMIGVNVRPIFMVLMACATYYSYRWAKQTETEIRVVNVRVSHEIIMAIPQ